MVSETLQTILAFRNYGLEVYCGLGELFCIIELSISKLTNSDCQLCQEANAIFGIVACATTGPEPAAPDVKSPIPDATVESPIGTASPAAAEGPIGDVEVPKVPQMAAAPAQTELVCRREKRTGSHRVTKVCTTRAEIERRRVKDRDALDQIRRAPTASQRRESGTPSPE